MVASINKMTTRTTKSHTTSLKLRTAGILRNLIAICFLVSVALGADQECKSSYCYVYGCERRSFTLTTQKEKLINTASTSTGEFLYHPRREHKNRWPIKNNHKFQKVNGGEWFSITKMLDHDKMNNRILVQTCGITDRWIYYLEHDGMDFIELLRGKCKNGVKEHTTEKTCVAARCEWEAVDVNLRSGEFNGSSQTKVNQGRVEGLPCKCSIGDDFRGEKNWDTPSRITTKGWSLPRYQDQDCPLEICGGSGRVFPTQEELKRGDTANGVYGFRVKFVKDSSFSTTDEESVCVYLKQCRNCEGTGYDYGGCHYKNDMKKSKHVLRKWATLGSCNDEDKKCKDCDGKGFLNTVHYITLPQSAGKVLEAHIEKINCFQEGNRHSRDSVGTVVVRITRVLGSNSFNIGNRAADRILTLGGKDGTGIEGKKLLKFLIDYAGEETDITDDSNFKMLQKTMTADWDLNMFNQVSASAALEILPTGADQPDDASGAAGPNARRLADRLAWN